jgi:hypothetical protein
MSCTLVLQRANVDKKHMHIKMYVCMYSDNLHIAAYATSRFKAALHSSNIDVFS